MSGFMISGWQVAKANITLMDAKGINGQPSRLKGRIIHVVAGGGGMEVHSLRACVRPWKDFMAFE